MKHTLPIATLIMAALLAPAAHAETGSELFQKALVKERSEGDLKEAIKLYQQVVEKYGKDRALAAKALVAIGQSYEKLGSPETRKAYDRVVREFADQPESAALARTRLAALQPAAPQQATLRQVATDPVMSYGSVSQDGKYLALTTMRQGVNGNLEVRDLSTGTNRQITHSVGGYAATGAAAQNGIISPDNRQVAFTWPDGKGNYDLRVVPLAGDETGIGKSLRKSGETGYILPAAWTPDGQSLVVLQWLKDDTSQIAIVNAADGTVRPLKSLEWRWPNRASLSPDGRYLAYDLPAGERGSTRDIFVLAMDGSQETVVIRNPGNDHSPVWSPDGSRVIFVSDRTRNNSMWSVSVQAGKAKGEPELVKDDIGTLYPIGMTRNGALYYVAGGGRENVYISEVDSEMKVTKPPVLAIDQFVNSNGYQSWSPDGESLGYLSLRGPADVAGSLVLAIRAMKTGQDRVVPTKLRLISRPVRWFPDGRSILMPVARTTAAQPTGYYRVDLETGDGALVYSTPIGPAHDLSRDGQTLVHVVFDPESNSQKLMRVDLANGRETELKRSPRDDQKFFTSLAISPDGKEVAYVFRDQRTHGASLEVIPTAGGASRGVFLGTPWVFPATDCGIAWAPDQKHLLFMRGLAEEGSGSITGSIWKVSAAGGQPENTGISLKFGRSLRPITFPSIHPDGRKIAHGIREMTATEAWVLENFLPQAAAKR